MKTLLALLLLPAGFALAQATPEPAAPASPDPAKPLATRAEYSACLDKAEALQANRKALEVRRAAYDEGIATLQADMTAHADAGNSIDDSKKGRLASYNARGAELNGRRIRLASDATQLGKDLEDHNRRSNELKTQCGGMKVSPEDRDAVQAERAKKK
ncbi:hypothetical protein BWI17_18670 [Betaproteobacteria bacterium GR16-43]|nr:hypothetical protein BWI17_18670 [Betaproteobacteria bacterium GR16-43]